MSDSTAVEINDEILSHAIQLAAHLGSEAGTAAMQAEQGSTPQAGAEAYRRAGRLVAQGKMAMTILLERAGDIGLSEVSDRVGMMGELFDGADRQLDELAKLYDRADSVGTGSA